MDSPQKRYPLDKLIKLSKPLFSCSKETRDAILEIVKKKDEDGKDLSVSKKVEEIREITSDNKIVAAARFLAMIIRDYNEEELEQAIVANSN